MFTYRVLTDYIHHALKGAKFTTLDDMSVAGTIPGCKGVIAFANSTEECREVLQSTLESWILLGLKTNRSLPIIHGIDLNKEPMYENEFSFQS